MSDDSLGLSPGPALRATLLTEAAIPLCDLVRPLANGYWAAPSPREVLLLDPELQVVSRFPIPEELTYRPSDSDEAIRVDVSPDHKWVVLAGTDCMMVVDPTGHVAWRTTYAPFRDAGGDPVPACAVFSPDSSELWAFVPTLGPSSDDDWVDDAERWVVETSDWHVTAMAETRYRGITDITVHPDRQQLGFAYFNGHEPDGTWTTWHDNAEGAPTQGGWFPLDISADGHRWLGGTWHDIVVGDFTGTTIRLNEDGHWDDWEFTPGACFVSPVHVLVAGRHDNKKYRHLVFSTDTLEPMGYIAYPMPFPDEHDTESARSHSDGTWLTMHIPGYARPDEGRIRRWALAGTTDV
ncbi:hypothetical protein [Yinghuangia aomiensis]